MQWSIPSMMASRTPPPVSAPTGLVLGAFDQQTGLGNAMPAHSMTSVPAGALLIIMTAIGSAAGGATISSTPSLTWTKQADVEDSCTELHTAVFTAGGSISVTPNWGVAVNGFSVCQVVTGQESTLGGATLSVEATAGPNFGQGARGDITTTRTNSIIFGVVGDRNNQTGTITYLESATQIYAQQLAGPFFYVFYLSVPTISLHTLGMSSPGAGRGKGCVYMRFGHHKKYIWVRL